MLAIRLQRLGRKAMPIYRVAVQEAQRTPSSGRVVAYVGTYNPHTKAVTFDKEKVEFYLKNGAQPSPRVVRLLEADKITLPAWVKKAPKKEGKVRHAEKLRKNQPKQEAPAEQPAEAPAAESAEEKTKE
ncbi:MAG TPA: 30S ribosomal protein S16 [Magnetospirillaceae bacterium]|nr:30S ribosomal protein S16 [Magnetospirillaceae bacterium]